MSVAELSISIMLNLNNVICLCGVCQLRICLPILVNSKGWIPRLDSYICKVTISQRKLRNNNSPLRIFIF